MIAILAIARSTILEMRRQRLFIVPIIGVVLSLLAIAGVLLLSDDSTVLLSREAEIAAFTASVGAMFGAALYAIIIGSSLIAREISGGTMLMLAARPIGRSQIVLGRALGAAAFLLVSIIVVCLVYGLVAALLSTSIAPLDEPFRALVFGGPAILLGLAVSLAFSVQGKATAATGSAIAVCAFALFVGFYAQDWRADQHLRSYLTDDVREQTTSNDRLIGPAAWLVARAIPFTVFAVSSTVALDERYAETYDTYDRADRTKPIRTDRVDGGGALGYGGYVGAAYPADPTTAVDPTMGEPVAPAASANLAEAAETAADAPTNEAPVAPPDPIAGTTRDYEPPELPDDPTREAYECAEWNNAECFLGYKNAWTKREIPPLPRFDDGASLLFAWLMIPAWIGVAILLLRRRRDLS
jgi:hypothetical protein